MNESLGNSGSKCKKKEADWVKQRQLFTQSLPETIGRQ
jgi:hypothetical protein